MGNISLSISADDAVHESSKRMLESLECGAIKKHVLTNSSVPFALKQSEYLAGYERLFNSRNYNYILMCEGTEI